MANARAKRDLQQVMVRMPPDLHDAVKKAAEKSDLTMAQAVRAAVRHWLQGDCP
jgi:predicted HicB family RNase H-like nuclease